MVIAHCPNPTSAQVIYLTHVITTGGLSFVRSAKEPASIVGWSMGHGPLINQTYEVIRGPTEAKTSVSEARRDDAES